MKKRVEWVDIYKGFLIFLVVLGHAFQGIASDHTLTSDMYYKSILYSKWLIYSFHMPAFFIAAGFFGYNLIKKISFSYFWHRFRRLAYPYFFWGFITALFMQLASKFSNNGLGLIDFVYSPIKPFSIFWFLYVYFFIFLIQFVLTILFKSNSNKIFLGLAVILFLGNPFIPKIWILKMISTYMIYYAIGLYTLAIVSKYNSFFSKQWTIVLWIIVFSIAFGFYFEYMKQNISDVVYYLNFITSVVGSFLFICLSIIVSNWHNWFSGINDYFGKYSMQIYVVHLLPLACARILLLRIFHFSNLWIISIGITTVSILVCILVIEISKKLHIQKVLFG